ncbi:YpeB-like protein with putative protease inhibitory function [Halomonas ventosae]|uniref:YpeB-like protein with putative protease inhibitory function n=1 Tax=Halomonas ventosae TaxID=229007 RepID=A0A4V3DQF1_9GAMM|nr:PepSY domain-containing protein [Halomonas ventosae]TDR55956.1 YpeB-like protein with putative protease inhibitory function [Halomonas ventosae]
MQRKMILTASLAALLGATTLAQAADDHLATERIDEVLAQAGDFGFQTYEEIEVKSRDRVEVEGWLDDEWQAEVRFDLASGESLKEERKRRDDGAWGLSEAEVRDAMALAVAEGMAEFEELQVDRDGRVEVEGVDADGRELEVRSRGGELLEVEHD